MASVRAMADRLLSLASDRDGTAATLQAEALAKGAALAALPEFESNAAPRRLLASSAGGVTETLSQKVLDGWVRNRHQTLYPLTMNFRTLPAAAAGLLIAAAAAALRAGEPDRGGTGGTGSDRADLDRATLWLRTVGADDRQVQALADAFARPPALHELLDAVLAARLGPQAYAVALASLDQRPRVNRLFLDYLAARLAIPADVARSLAQRYRL